MNPTKVFAVLAGLVIVIAGVFYLLRDNPAPTPTTTDRPDFSLTDTEAIARAKELEQLVLTAYRTRDISLLPTIYAPESKLLKKTRREITYLKRQGVEAETHYRLINIEVVSNSDDTIVLEEEAEFDVRFTDRQGRDVTQSGRLELQRTRLTLARVGSEWLIQDSLIVDATPLE